MQNDRKQHWGGMVISGVTINCSVLLPTIFCYMIGLVQAGTTILFTFALVIAVTSVINFVYTVP